MHDNTFWLIAETSALRENSDNFDLLRRGREIDCNQEALLVRGVRPLIDFN